MITAKKSIGNFGEQLARDFLLRRGYEIISRNEKIGRWEFDLIARLKNLTIFVEVKTSAAQAMTPAEFFLTRRQIEILFKAAISYCWRKKIDPAATRLDFISINLNLAAKTARIRHYKNIN